MILKQFIRHIKWVGLLAVLALGIQTPNAFAGELEPLKPTYSLSLDAARAVAWSPDGKTLAVGTDSGIYLMDGQLKPIWSIANPVQEIESLVWSPDGQFIAASSLDIQPESAVRVWNAATQTLVTTFKGQMFGIPAIGWSPDGQKIASGSWDGTVQIWDPFTAIVSQTFTHIPEKGQILSYVYNLTWSPKGDRVAAIIVQHGIYEWDVQSGTLALTISVSRPMPPISSTIAWSPNGSYLADGYRLLDAASGSTIREFQNCPDTDWLDWHPSSNFLAIYAGNAPDDYSVYICDVRTDMVVTRLEGGMDTDLVPLATYRNSLDWNPDGKRLAGAAGDGIVRIWDVPIPES